MSSAQTSPVELFAEYPNLIVTSHPFLKHKVSVIRDRDTSKKTFKEAVDEIAMLMAYEVTADIRTEEYEVATPLESSGHLPLLARSRADGARDRPQRE